MQSTTPERERILENQLNEQERKITRTEKEYHDLIIKTEYLKTQKQSIKK